VENPLKYFTAADTYPISWSITFLVIHSPLAELPKPLPPLFSKPEPPGHKIKANVGIIYHVSAQVMYGHRDCLLSAIETLIGEQYLFQSEAPVKKIAQFQLKLEQLEKIKRNTNKFCIRRALNSFLYFFLFGPC
jgi:hypothetical protein